MVGPYQIASYYGAVAGHINVNKLKELHVAGSWQFWIILSLSNHSKLFTRLLRCFVLEQSVFKTKHLRSLSEYAETNWLHQLISSFLKQ